MEKKVGQNNFKGCKSVLGSDCHCECYIDKDGQAEMCMKPAVIFLRKGRYGYFCAEHAEELIKELIKYWNYGWKEVEID